MITMPQKEKKEEEKEEEESEKKSVSIKGVRADIYNRMMGMAKDTGRTLGELTNDAYRSFIATVEGAKNVSKSFLEGAGSAMPRTIENIKTLEITREDLEEIKHKVSFRNINELIFKDVDDETFEKYVVSIVGVKKLMIPAKMKKSKVLLRSSFVDEIIQE